MALLRRSQLAKTTVKITGSRDKIDVQLEKENDVRCWLGISIQLDANFWQRKYE